MKGTGKYTKQFILIVFAIVVVCYLSWKFALSKTVEQFSGIKQAEQQLGMIEDAPAQTVRMKERLEQLEQLVGSSGGSLNFEQVVESVSNYISRNAGVVLCSLPPVHASETDDYLIETYTLDIQGSYPDLVRFMNYFELHREIGRYASAAFFTVQNRETKQKELHLKIYIQSFPRK